MQGPVASLVGHRVVTIGPSYPRQQASQLAERLENRYTGTSAWLSATTANRGSDFLRSRPQRRRRISPRSRMTRWMWVKIKSSGPTLGEQITVSESSSKNPQWTWTVCPCGSWRKTCRARGLTTRPGGDELDELGFGQFEELNDLLSRYLWRVVEIGSGQPTRWLPLACAGLKKDRRQW